VAVETIEMVYIIGISGIIVSMLGGIAPVGKTFGR